SLTAEAFPTKKLRRISESSVQTELRPVVISDSAIVIVVGLRQSLNGRDHFLRPVEEAQRSLALARLAHAGHILVHGIDGVPKLAFGLGDAGSGRFCLGVGLRHLSGHAVLDAE